MKRSGSGRVARKIGAYEESSVENTDPSQDGGQPSPTESVVKRPIFAKGKKRSSLRISFGPGDSEGNDGDNSSDAAVITPKKSNLSRIAAKNNAERSARSPLLHNLPRSHEEDEERPKYSKDYLAELRNSTPSTPKDLEISQKKTEDSRSLDIASKFGSSSTLQRNEPSAIPTEAEIQEKKARRAWLAKEQKAHDVDEDQPWASDDDDEFRTSKNEISLRPKEKYAETRLVHDDEDIAEGFDDFVEDGRINLGRKAEKEAQKKRRAEMADMINTAEHGSDDDGSEDSEADRNAAYEAAQTRAGAYGGQQRQIDRIARTPPRISPLPDMREVIERLAAEIGSKEQQKQIILQKLEEQRSERSRIADRKEYLQEQLQKTGAEYEKLRLEAGMVALPVNGGEGGRLIVNRGLDSLGTTPLGGTPEHGRSTGNSDEE